MKGTSTFRLTLTALFAALACVTTMFIRMPSPLGGYVNLGDGFVLLAGFLLGPIWGGVAAGLGSMLADLLAGYPMYAAGTLIIKGLVALTAGMIFQKLGRDGLKAIIPAALCGELLMVAGYFVFSALCLGYGLGAVATIPGDIGQGVAGIAVSALLTPALMRSHEIREMLDKI